MKTLLIQPDSVIAARWSQHYETTAKTLGIQEDYSVTVVESISSCLAALECGDVYDLVVIGDSVSGMSRFASQAIASIRSCCPDLPVHVVSDKDFSPQMQELQLSDPFVSLAIRRPSTGLDPDLEILIKEIYRKGKSAIAQLDRQVLPLAEQVRYLEETIVTLRAELSRFMDISHSDSQRSMDLCLETQDETAVLSDRLSQLERSLGRLERKTKDLVKAQESISSLTSSLSLVSRFWKLMLTVSTLVTGLTLIIERLIRWLA